MLPIIFGESRIILLAGIAAAFLCSFLGIRFGMSSLPRDGGRKFAVNGALSKGKPRGAGLIFVAAFTVCGVLFVRQLLTDRRGVVVGVVEAGDDEIRAEVVLGRGSEVRDIIDGDDAAAMDCQGPRLRVGRVASPEIAMPETIDLHHFRPSLCANRRRARNAHLCVFHHRREGPVVTSNTSLLAPSCRQGILGARLRAGRLRSPVGAAQRAQPWVREMKSPVVVQFERSTQP